MSCCQQQHAVTVEVPTNASTGARLPSYATDGAAGADVCAFIDEAIVLEPGQRSLVPTGLRFQIPDGYEIQVRPRSGLALKHGLTLVNSPGTIDSDYRGELAIIVINHGKEPFEIVPAMRLAQLVVARVERACFVTNGMLTSSVRGDGGFGHTGTESTVPTH